jgi:hypothetical protein
MVIYRSMIIGMGPVALEHSISLFRHAITDHNIVERIALPRYLLFLPSAPKFLLSYRLTTDDYNLGKRN